MNGSRCEWVGMSSSRREWVGARFSTTHCRKKRGLMMHVL